MPKTITLQDSTIADLLAALGAATPTSPAPGPTPAPDLTPPSALAGVVVVDLPWRYQSGLVNAQIPAGGSIAFHVAIPLGYSSKQQLCGFSFAPTGGGDYFFRDYALSTRPADFSNLLQSNNEAGTLYFTVGGPRVDKYGRPMLDNPDLGAGQTYYFNVRQQDPTLSCRINYSLAIV